MNEWYSTEQVQNMVDFLRRSANKDGGLDVGEYWALCDEAADMIESMLHYEQSHGLRKTLEESESQPSARRVPEGERLKMLIDHEGAQQNSLGTFENREHLHDDPDFAEVD